MVKEKVNARRSPKYLPFLILFGSIGFVSAIVLNFFTVAGGQSILGYLIGYLSVLGAIVGLIVALILDSISRRRSKIITLDRSR